MCVKDILEIIYWAISLGILCATVYYISHSPVNAVRIGRQLNNEQQQDNTKRNLFLTLFSYRGSPLNQHFVTGLNQIDIVFHDVPLVLTAWHNHLRDLNTKHSNPIEAWERSRTELLSAMAVNLGYGQLNQVDIMLHYYPQGYDDQNKYDAANQQNWKNYLESTIEMNCLLIAQLKANKLPSDGEKTA
jgi:hypothetical protein